MSIHSKVMTMSRAHKRWAMVIFDFIALPLAMWSSYVLRLSDWWPAVFLAEIWWLFFVIPLLGVYTFSRIGLYRAIVRFMSTQAVWSVVKGVGLLALFLWAIAFIFKLDPFPRSVAVIFALIALVYVGGSRLLVRHYYQWLLTHFANKNVVIIYGAGSAGIQLASALSGGRDYYPIAFVDEDASIWGATIKGLSVYSPKHIPDLLKKHTVTHVLLAMPTITNRKKWRILDSLQPYSLHVQTIPSMSKILSGQASVEQLREIDIGSLLGRDPVPPHEELLALSIANQSVMITGAGGSIGSEICRQAMGYNPRCLILYDVCEYALYKVEQELSAISARSANENNGVKVVALLGSICDAQRVSAVIEKFHVNTIYHAAAYKHVPMVEHNVIEGVRNNVLGTHVVANAAINGHVDRFILISTDKAVRPTNVMGATKRMAELSLQCLARKSSKTIFSMVRFGNVMDSSGSVIPKFRQQIREGGPITITHKNITRYFMTISEAACLVIQAGSMARGGDIFVLDMGEPVKIYELAKRMIRLAGLEPKTDNNPEGDITLEVVGLRPGEKLYEELLIVNNVTATKHPKILKTKEEYIELDVFDKILPRMQDAILSNNAKLARDVLQQCVAGYKPDIGIVDHLQKNQHIRSIAKNHSEQSL